MEKAVRIIEVMGVPGSGKTTFVNELRNRVGHDSGIVYGNDIPTPLLDRWTRFCLFVLTRPRLYRPLCRVLWQRWRSGLYKDTALVLRRFAQRVAQYAYAKDTYRGYTVVFDEGLLQRLHGLFIFSPTRFDAEAHYRLVQCMPPVDTVILLRQDTPNAQARIMKRGVPHRWRGKSKEEVEQYLEHTQKLISDVVSQQKTLTRRFLVDPTVEVLLNAIAYGEE